MKDRAGIMDGIAGLAGGALSMVVGLREEIESVVQTKVDFALGRLKLARIDDLEAVQIMASNARLAQQEAETRLAAMEARLAALESQRP